MKQNVLAFSINGRECSPVYPSSLQFTFERGSEERYYRTKLGTSLIFTDLSGDYSYIRAQAIDAEFKITVTVTDIRTRKTHFTWHGVFYKTDCEFNDDVRTLSVTPEVDDLYKRVLECIDNKYDLVSLAPAQRPCILHKRPILQIYVTVDGIGDEIVTNYLGGMAWEQTATNNADDPDSVSSVRKWLTDTCHFKEYSGCAAFELKITGKYAEYSGLYLSNSGGAKPTAAGTYQYVGESGNIIKVVITYTYVEGTSDSDSDSYWTTETSLVDKDGNTLIPVHSATTHSSSSPLAPDFGDGDITAVTHEYRYYLRYILGFDTSDTYAEVNDGKDIVAFDLNYKYCAPFDTSSKRVIFSSVTQEDPTEYGKNEQGSYFTYPSVPDVSGTTYTPIAKSTWSPLSVWLADDPADETFETLLGVEYTLGQAYPVAEVIKTLLKEIDSNDHYGVKISHGNTSEYSDLYEQIEEIFISPQSAVKRTYYSDPAQKGEISLRQVLDMLRDCFNCYWYIDSEGRFKIEPVDWFRQGKAFGESSSRILQDMTAIQAPRNFKAWSFGQNSWSYDKPELPERVEFSWAEQSTAPFKGTPLQYKSNYVQLGETDSVSIDGFSADVDYDVSMKDEVSDDGWVLIIGRNVRHTLSSPTLTSSTGIFSPNLSIPTQNDDRLWNITGKVTAMSLVTQVTFYVDAYNASSALLASYSLGTIKRTGVFPLYFNFSQILPKETASVRFRFSGALLRGTFTAEWIKMTRDAAEVPIGEVEYKGVTVRPQNYLATRVRLFYDYLRYDMSCDRFEFNGYRAEQNAEDSSKKCLTTKRVKKQDTTSPAPDVLDPYGIVVTGLGTGEIESMEYTPLSDSVKLKLDLDTES